jgi:hypothetical protein
MRLWRRKRELDEHLDVDLDDDWDDFYNAA